MGYFIKRNDNDFIMDIELTQEHSGYNVVPKEIDPWNKYNIEEVRVYVDANLKMEVVWNNELGKYVPILV